MGLGRRSLHLRAGETAAAITIGLARTDETTAGTLEQAAGETASETDAEVTATAGIAMRT
jgi:hypothetical protein